MPSSPRPDDDPRPEPPERPDDDACCRCGCDPCIFDLYDAEVDRWRAELAAWELRQAARRPAKHSTRTTHTTREPTAKVARKPKA